MSTTIDEKVVKMRFDNQQFESNVQTSLNTLDRLKKSLDMEGAAKGWNRSMTRRSGVICPSSAVRWRPFRPDFPPWRSWR